MTTSQPDDRAGYGTSRRYFDEMYADDPDPWDFDTSWYEQRKYALTLAALPKPRYRRGVEPGCANGALTIQLAQRCDEIVAYDFIDTAVATAQRRLADNPNVAVMEADFPSAWPDGTGDLVVWSEIAYYLNDLGAAVAIEGLERWLEPAGHLLAVHYTGTTNYSRSGRSIGPWLDDVPWLSRVVQHCDPSFDLGVWERSADERSE